MALKPKAIRDSEFQNWGVGDAIPGYRSSLMTRDLDADRYNLSDPRSADETKKSESDGDQQEQ